MSRLAESRLAEGQRAFAAALLDPARPIPPGLVGPDGIPSPRRFGVYRNNVVAGLVATMEQAYPAVRRVVGDDFFAAMARAYVMSRPPRSPILLAYGDGFAAFIGGFEPAAPLPYLADVARIEWAWTQAYHAAEAVPLTPNALAAIDAARFPHLRLILHPSMGVVRSHLPALTIWRMNVGGGVPEPVDLCAGGEDALILRPQADVEVRALPPGGAAFVLAIADGATVLEAARAAAADDDRFALADNIAGVIRAGMLVGVRDDAGVVPAHGPGAS